MRTVRLKPGEERRLLRGHLWVFSNELDGSPKKFEPGEAVTVLDSKGRPVGSGTINPHSLIAVRLHSRKPDVELDAAMIERRIGAAWNLRRRIGYTDVCRVVHGEADGLPGLIVDRYGHILTVQHNSAGMDRRREKILEVLDRLFVPRCVIATDETPSRELENLPQQRSVAGDTPDEIEWYEQDGLKYPLDLKEGQKTGGYLDQATSRRLVAGLAEGLHVLDAFSYTGGFGMLAASQGALDVTLVDRSERALEIAREAFRRNKLREPVIHKLDLLHGKVTVGDLGGPFDLVVSDPPPLAKSRSSQKEGLRKMEELIGQTVNWTNPSGFAAVFSCSHLIGRDDLVERVKRAERKVRRRLTRLAMLEAGPDHPVAVTHPESDYLHGVLLTVG